ncbi:MAG: WD40/YVTN/BNR-like repeat-containing protein [Waterburya sp.]
MKWDHFKIWDVIRVCLLSMLMVFCCNLQPAFAHSPHDVVIGVELSPDYAQDQTAYYLLDGYFPFWGNLAKSKDGGESWTRIEKGLDNRHPLSSLAVSLQDKQILFLSTLGDGIYKSQDEGRSWFKVNQGLETLSIDQVAFDPNSADLALAVGTKSGLYKTENGGVNWTAIDTGASKVTAVAFDSKGKQIIVGDNQGSLFMSGEPGESWRKLATLKDSGMIQAVAIAPDSETVWVGTSKVGVWQTVDNGVSFTPVNKGLKDLTIMSLALSPNYQTDKTIIASTWDQGVFVSQDGGQNWQKQNRGLKKHSQADTALYQSPHFSDLSISQTYSQDGTLFLAGFDGVFKSTNGGDSWRDVNIGKGATSIRTLAISPNYQQDGTIAISTLFQGVYLSRDRGKTWTAFNHGLGFDRLLKQNLIAEIGDLFFSPNYSVDQTLLGSTWGGIATSQGKFWQQLRVPKSFRRDSYMVVSPNYDSDRTVYLVTLPGKILKSTDAGKNFTNVGEIGTQAAFIPSFAISPNFATDQTLYMGNFSGGIYKSVDAGATWQTINNGLSVKDNYAKLAISPNYQTDQTLLAGTSQGLLISQDAGTSWRKLPGTAYGGDSYIENIAISPNYQSDSTFLISVRGKGLFKTVDAGTTFTQIGDYVTGPIQFSPNYATDQTIFSSSGAELYQSTNGGDTWQPLVVPKPDYNFLTILYHFLTNSPGRRYLVAALTALFCYFISGYLRLGKKLKLPFSKWQLKTSGVFTVFLGTLIFLSV